LSLSQRPLCIVRGSALGAAERWLGWVAVRVVEEGSAVGVPLRVRPTTMAWRARGVASA